MRRVALFVPAALVLSACSAAEAPPSTPEPPARLQATDVSSLRVSGQQEQGTALNVRLSPDGKTLVYMGQEGTCLRGVDGSNEHCLPPGVGLDISSADWSPDGRELAITDVHAIGLEPDIWVLDVASGDLTNLTDDGIESEGVSLTSREMPEGATVDVFPSWSADGEQIRFLRKESANSVGVLAVSPAGGEPTRLGRIDTSWEKLQTAAWSDDSVAWLSAPAEGEGGEVLVAATTGADPHKVLDGAYRVLSFSADGNFLLADRRTPDGYAGTGTARVVPARGGDPVPVADGPVRFPGWAPDGHAIVYVESPDTLRVVGRPGDAPRELHRGTDLKAADHDNIDWVPGRMLVSPGGNHPVVLTIDGT